jgi:hypothetical protein
LGEVGEPFEVGEQFGRLLLGWVGWLLAHLIFGLFFAGAKLRDAGADEVGVDAFLKRVELQA